MSVSSAPPDSTCPQMNISLFAFNLLVPAYPLDGGRILANGLLAAGVEQYLAAKVTVVPLASQHTNPTCSWGCLAKQEQELVHMFEVVDTCITHVSTQPAHEGSMRIRAQLWQGLGFRGGSGRRHETRCAPCFRMRPARAKAACLQRHA